MPRSTANRRLQPATPLSRRRQLPPMPRQRRDAPPPARLRGRSGRMFLGRPWPLPVAPLPVVLVLVFTIAAGIAWAVEGRYTTTPAEAAKRLVPYKAEDVQSVTLTTTAGTATYIRGANGKLTTGGPTPVPSPTPAPQATPGPVVLAPSTKLEGLIGQIADLTIDRSIASEASHSAEFGLDAPRMTLTLTPKTGKGPGPATIAIGRLNPNETAYYVRREARKDTVLVARYMLDDLMKVADDVVAAPT